MKPSSLLIFEPRLGGHHLSWLRYVSEDLLAAGFRLTLAVDLRSGKKEQIAAHLADLLAEVTMLPVFDEAGGYRGGSKTGALVTCLQESGAEQIFMTNFDEVASSWLRRAAFGMTPPRALRGRLNGVYFRPRFLANRWWPLGNALKAAGFKRLCRKGWFHNLYLLDEYLCPPAEANYPGCKVHFLPDPWSGNFTLEQTKARQQLGVPLDRFVFLHYGLGTRRKGLHLVIAALEDDGLGQSFLLCAGAIAEHPELRQGVAALQEKGRGMVLDRYVTLAEEELCFAAADVVLLPYVAHFGSSAVLSRAAAAGKLVIASHEGLVARRVKDHGLGLLFASAQVGALRQAMATAIALPAEQVGHYRQAARRYAQGCTRQAFRTVLLNSLVAE